MSVAREVGRSLGPMLEGIPYHEKVRFRPLIMHTVVSGKAVNDVHVVPQRLSVLLGYEHRSDLSPAGADPRQILRREEEMMWRRLARHRPTLLLRGADHCNLKQTKD